MLVIKVILGINGKPLQNRNAIGYYILTSYDLLHRQNDNGVNSREKLATCKTVLKGIPGEEPPPVHPQQAWTVHGAVGLDKICH